MPGEMIGEAASGVLRFIGRLLLEIVIELMVKGAGYAICRMFTRRVDPEGFAVLVVGFAFWIALGSAGYGIYRWL